MSQAICTSNQKYSTILDLLKCRADLRSDTPLDRVGSTAFAVNSPYTFLPLWACKGLQPAFSTSFEQEMVSSSKSWKKRPPYHLDSVRVTTDGSSDEILFDIINIQHSMPSSSSILCNHTFAVFAPALRTSQPANLLLSPSLAYGNHLQASPRSCKLVEN